MSRALGFVGAHSRVHSGHSQIEKLCGVDKQGRLLGVERVEYKPYLQPEYTPMAGVASNKQIYSSPRGPCPSNITKQPSLPSILIDSEQKVKKYD